MVKVDALVLACPGPGASSGGDDEDEAELGTMGMPLRVCEGDGEALLEFGCLRIRPSHAEPPALPLPLAGDGEGECDGGANAGLGCC